MSYTQNNIALLDKKEAQTMTVLPTNTGAGSLIIAPSSGAKTYALYVTSATVMYLYNHDDDGYSLIPSGGLAGAFGVGTTGVAHPWSINYTATGGSTTTLTVNMAAFPMTGICIGADIEFLTGTAGNIGLRRTITAFCISGTTATLTLSSPVTSVANNDTFKLSTGRFFVLNAYATLAAGVWKVFDICTMTWQANLQTTGLPAAWAVSGQMILPYTRYDVFATGQATSGSATTLVNSAKAWTVDQWIGYQVRITAGTGQGQRRVITDNDGTTLTFATGATIDNTSQYSIEGDEDLIYLMGNGAITMYTYRISTNTWATVSPVAARVGTPTTVMLGNWIGLTGDTCFDTENTIQAGKWIYSPRGAATSTLTRYNIPGNTWETVTTGITDTFTTGSSMTVYGCYAYLTQNATGKMFQYHITGNYIQGYFTDNYTQSTAVMGDKLWLKVLNTTDNVAWMYYALNTSNVVRRIMVY